MISFPQIIKYMAVTRKHYNLVLLEIMIQVHNWREMTGRRVLSDTQLGPERCSTTHLQDTEMASPEHMSSHETGLS